MRLIRNQHSEVGSIPLALLASIIVGGLVVVLTATVLQSERSVRFDRAYTDVVQAADAGVQTAYHQLNHPKEYPSLAALATGGNYVAPADVVHNGSKAKWSVRRIGPREYEVTSTGTSPDGTARTVVSSVKKDSLFFPGAFGDRLVAMNGTSTQIDSYDSGPTDAACSGNTDASKCWGINNDVFGTRKAALGTNKDFDFTGNTKVLRGVLYDWKANPGTGVTSSNPGGSRCNGNPCTEPDVIRTEADKLDYGSDAEMAFIQQKLQNCSGGREKSNWVFNRAKKSDPVLTLSPFDATAAGNVGSPADSTWLNYYCADSLQVLDDLRIENASPEKPVVVFVRNSFSVAKQTTVAMPCLSIAGGCSGNFGQMATVRSYRPKAGSLQIYVLTEAPTKSANVLIDTQSVFAGVVYAPRATCGASGNAGVHVYGSLICRNIDNVGNWEFHYDEALSDVSRGTFTMSSWREEANPVS